MLHYVHSSLIYNSQKLERTQMSLNREMDTENVVHLHKEYYLAIKNNEFIKFLGKWMELENIILSEVTQPQKNTHGMYLLISGYCPKAWNTQVTTDRPHEAQDEGRPKCGYFVLSFLSGFLCYLEDFKTYNG